MHKYLLLGTLSATILLNSASTYAQRPGAQGWLLGLGAGVMSTPSFNGSKDYQVSVLPYVKLSYKNLFFASVQEGIGFNLIRQGGWEVGPIVRYRFSRKEDTGSKLFRVSGSTDALRGLGDVSGTFEPGGFINYSWQKFSTELEMRQGLSGHKGFIGTLKVSYKQKLNQSGPPIFLSISPRVKMVSDNYTDAYFSINQVQSINSGLPQYQADGGLHTYGIGSTLIATLSQRASIVAFVGYDRLTGDAADSPLVRFRGDRNQFNGGAFFVYQFPISS